MDSLPDLSESAESAREGVKNLISWLPDPYECDDCNVYCDATETYNPQTAAFDGGACPAWECPHCGREYVRVESWHE
jgi:hypothetical protein